MSLSLLRIHNFFSDLSHPSSSCSSSWILSFISLSIYSLYRLLFFYPTILPDMFKLSLIHWQFFVQTFLIHLLSILFHLMNFVIFSLSIYLLFFNKIYMYPFLLLTYSMPFSPVVPHIMSQLSLMYSQFFFQTFLIPLHRVSAHEFCHLFHYPFINCFSTTDPFHVLIYSTPLSPLIIYFAHIL